MNARPYDKDLAFIHHTGFGGFAEGSAPGLLELLKQRGIESGKVIDLGCGSGIWAGHLLAAGYQALGVDISPQMIDLAREIAPRAELHVGSFLDFRFPPCSAVTALGEVLCYLFDRRNQFQALKRVCRRVYQALFPGGLFVFDLAETTLRRRPPGFRQTNDWCCLVEYEDDDKQQRLTRRITTYRRMEKNLFRRSEETHVQQLYDRGNVAAMLREIGFRVRIVRSYGSFPLLPHRVGFIARKP